MEEVNNIVETVLENMPEVKLVDEGEDSKPYLIRPRTMETESMEKYLGFPRRLVEHVTFSDVSGFIAYAMEFKDKRSKLFPDPSGVLAIFDYHMTGVPSWCEHRATYRMIHTPEWDTWRENRKVYMTQAEFATFLEGVISTIEEPKAADILAVVRAIRATVTSKVVSVVSDDGINANLEFKKSVEVKSSNEVELPKKIKVVLQPYFGVDIQYRLEIRLSYDLKNDGSAVHFSYDILNFKRAEKDAFDSVVKIIVDQTGLPSYTGGRIIK